MKIKLRNTRICVGKKTKKDEKNKKNLQKSVDLWLLVMYTNIAFHEIEKCGEQ